MTTAEKIVKKASQKVAERHFVSLKDADRHMIDRAIAESVLEEIGGVWAKSQKATLKGRHAAYISAEYLTGRAISNNLLALGALDEVRSLLSKAGASPDALEEEEDSALGNGGLGRLAACFLDSAATLALPVMGYGLKYRYGLFKQGIKDFRQTEEADDWTRFSDNWTVRREELAVTVEMKGQTVIAVPYDMPVIGYGGEYVATLRLWQTESPVQFDFTLFNDYKYDEASEKKNRAEDITKVLYPNDWTREGRLLRLKQEYVLSSASMQDILRSFEEKKLSFHALPRYIACQLNDTHPVLAIPELIRLLIKRGVSFRSAKNAAKQVFAFTNHTVMPEALEKWDMDLVSDVSEEIADILRRLDASAKRETGLRLIKGDRIHMADTAVYMSFAVNGVAKIHSELVKTLLFPDWYRFYPERFQNKTNGVTPRRWLALCDRELCALLGKYTDKDFVKDLDALKDISPTQELADELSQVKAVKREEFRLWLKHTTGQEIPEGFVIDAQVKRLHEYKRQLLNALSVYDMYMDMKEGKLSGLPPMAFVFAGKAAPGYARAKAVIRYVNLLADRINNDPDVNGRMRVLFVPNYNCSVAEKLIPATDFSEQISPAGTEASGTGNMKFMINGAVTVGTWDGANIEIAQAAGEENEYIFGARIEELDGIRETYDPKQIYGSDARVKWAVDSLTDAGFPDEDGTLSELKDSLLIGASWHRPDQYFLLKDFESYREARLKAYREYASDPAAFRMKALKNVLSCGVFSSDRTIRQYADEIWNIKKVK
ncbi:MAG: glycogen/starch/alpha-glucan family phosphorylase [Clostridiales bacterium]|nr:glycogen/starch/alpha-glucan family phosphorylase [Clostridiales bacterium]